MRAKLEAIRKLIETIGPVSDQQLMAIPQTAECEKFEWAYADTITIETALLQGGEDFIMPLIGGKLSCGMSKTVSFAWR